MKKVAIIGSHGLYVNYGGFEQLVNNLVEKKSDNLEYLIFNSADSQIEKEAPLGVTVKILRFKASGFQGLFYDFWSILISFWKVDTILLLGVQGIPLIAILRLFKKVKIVSNIGGLEWKKPHFGYFTKKYFRFCFNLSFISSDFVILDNPHYKTFLPKRQKANVMVLSYGGEIDTSIDINKDIEKKYSFINDKYYLSISRAIEDNHIDELCENFAGTKHKLVLISTFSSSTYGSTVYNKYCDYTNIILINGLYNKPELDLIRRKCKAYIHTHTLCGTAPSLVEMIIAQRPIISIENPQNKYTLHNQAFFFSTFSEIQELLNSKKDLLEFIPSRKICKLYEWSKIVSNYESLF